MMCLSNCLLNIYDYTHTLVTKSSKNSLYCFGDHKNLRGWHFHLIMLQFLREVLLSIHSRKHHSTFLFLILISLQNDCFKCSFCTCTYLCWPSFLLLFLDPSLCVSTEIFPTSMLYIYFSPLMGLFIDVLLPYILPHKYR